MTSASLPPSAGPVAAGVFEQLVGLRQPQRPHAALEAVVKDDGGDLAPLAGAGAVTQHPAAPKAHRRRVCRGAGIGNRAGIVATVLVRGVGTLDGLPVRGDAVTGIEPAAVGFACKDHAFKLGV